jgi:tetratricopeptide (TPR) repeat protein
MILEPIYRISGEWRKQGGVYEVMARHAFDPMRKLELLQQISELHEIGGDDSGAAFSVQARALREDPRNESTHAQLDRLARTLGRWSELVALYDEVTSEVGEDDLKVALLFKLANIHARHLNDDRSAVAAYERALVAAPGSVDAISAIQAIHERAANWPALVTALKRKSDILIDVPERKRLLHQAGQIEEDAIGDAEAAIATYRMVLAVDDMDMPAMDALERLYVRLGRWEALKDVYTKKAELAEDPDDKKRMLYVLAQVYDRELGDVNKGIDTYQSILDIDADELPAIQSLDRLYGAASRWYDLLGNLERQVELAESGGEMSSLRYRIGNLWQLHLGDMARAIDSYREALEIDPSHGESLAALDGIVRGKVDPVLAARVLEPIYDRAGEYAKLIEVLDVIVANTEDPVARVEMLHRIANLGENRLGDARAAFGAYARALRDDSGNELTLGHLERLAEVNGTWFDLGELYSAEAEKSLDVPRQVDLWSRLARVQEQERGDVERAIATYRRILEAEFDNKPAVAALDRLFTHTQRWRELAEILRREIQLADGDKEVLAFQLRLAATLQHSLGDRKAAIEVYREILTSHPTEPQTFEALEAMFFAGHHQAEIAQLVEPLYEATGDFDKLHRIYEVQLGSLVGPDRQGMYQRLAELAEHRLYDPARALQWWGQALGEDPRWEHATEEVERLGKIVEEWGEVAAIYQRALERHADSEIQRGLLLRLARVYEFELGEAAQAVSCHLRVLDLDAGSGDALMALDRLYLGAGMYDELVEILRRRIEVADDGDEQIELMFRRGLVFSDALGDLEAALACYRQVLDKESRNRRALESQEAIFFRQEEWQKLYETYEQMVDVAEGDAELADIYARMARLSSDTLGQDDRAVDLLGRVLDIRGEEAGALAAMGEIHARNSRWEEWIEVMERQAAVSQNDQEQIGLYKQMGRVWAAKLGRERNALDAWLAADRLNGRDMETLRALAQLYRSTQSWDELSQTLRRIIDVGTDIGAINEQETIELYVQLGQLEGEILGRIDEAVEAWRQVAALDPTDFRALGALEALFTREARWEEAIEIMEKRALVLDDEPQRLESLLQAAATWEEKLENLPAAATVYERVRQAQQGNVVASERLEAIYRALYKWTELSEVLLERVEHRTDVQQQITILNQVAKIYESELGDQEAAFYVLQAAFKRDYSHEGTARELERLATTTNRWQELLDEYTNRVNELEREDRVAAADLWVKIGRWYGEHLSHVDWAIHSIQPNGRPWAGS